MDMASQLTKLKPVSTGNGKGGSARIVEISSEAWITHRVQPLSYLLIICSNKTTWWACIFIIISLQSLTISEQKL